MVDLLERAPAHAVMEKLASLRGRPDVRDLPFGIVWLSRTGMGWYRGARGELELARMLTRLGPEWTVLHSIPVGTRGTDIDHLVIGPAGVFPINTKRLREKTVWVGGGKFLVDGYVRPYLPRSVAEARRVEKVLLRAGLRVPVLPVIAVSGAKRLRVKGTPGWDGRQVGVVASDQVVRRIRRRASLVPPGVVAQIAAVARNSSNWTASEVDVVASDHVQAEFDRIDRGVSRLTALLRAFAFVTVSGFSLAAITIGVWLR